jgi:hypothetical protein
VPVPVVIPAYSAGSLRCRYQYPTTVAMCRKQLRNLFGLAHAGLTKRWCSNNKGLIYCTTPTAKLASDRLKVRLSIFRHTAFAQLATFLLCRCAWSSVWLPHARHQLAGLPVMLALPGALGPAGVQAHGRAVHGGDAGGGWSRRVRRWLLRCAQRTVEAALNDVSQPCFVGQQLLKGVASSGRRLGAGHGAVHLPGRQPLPRRRDGAPR